ncbi:hypothetical protein D9M69_733430 [compost metagenome]
MIGKLLAEGDSDNCLGIAVLARSRIAHQVIPGFAETVLLEKGRPPQKREFIHRSLDGGRALQEGKLGHLLRVLAVEIPINSQPCPTRNQALLR